MRLETLGSFVKNRYPQRRRGKTTRVVRTTEHEQAESKRRAIMNHFIGIVP